MMSEHECRAVSPAIATVALIAIAAAAASIAGSEVIRKTALLVRTTPIEIGEMFMVKIADTGAHVHAGCRIKPGWVTVTVSFKDDSGATITLTLPDVAEYDTVINTRITIVQKDEISRVIGELA